MWKFEAIASSFNPCKVAAKRCAASSRCECAFASKLSLKDRYRQKKFVPYRGPKNNRQSTTMVGLPEGRGASEWISQDPCKSMMEGAQHNAL
jgi:hypothetical protein